MTRDPREALVMWIASTGYTHREVGALFEVTKGAVNQWTRGIVRVPKRVQRRLVAEGWLPRREPRSTPRAPLNHQPPCPPGTPCRSCYTRRRWAHGPLGVRRDLWTPEAEARLRALAGTTSVDAIGAQLTAEFGVERTGRAVMVRCQRLGLSITRQAYTAAQVAYICGVDEATVTRWVAREWLASERTHCRAAHVITAETFEAFLRAHPGVVDWQDMPVQRGRERCWRELVYGLWQRARFYDAVTVARWLRVHPHTVTRWCLTGQLQGWQVPGGHGNGGLPRWRIPHAAVLAFEQERAAAAGPRAGGA